MSKLTSPDHGRYLRIVRWAEKRYTFKGALVTFGNGQPSIFKVIEMLAWDRYINLIPKGPR